MRKTTKILNLTITVLIFTFMSLSYLRQDIIGERVTIDQIGSKRTIPTVKIGLKEKLSVIDQNLNCIGSFTYTTLKLATLETQALAKYIISQNRKIDPETAVAEAGAFIKYSYQYGVPIDLAVAVANTESHFKPHVSSSHGSAGVMQVTWRVHKDLLKSHGINSREELYDPVIGIKAGCILISRYLKKFKSVKSAMGRYYGGSADVYWNRISKNLSRYRTYEKKRTKSS